MVLEDTSVRTTPNVATDMMQMQIKKKQDKPAKDKTKTKDKSAKKEKDEKRKSIKYHLYYCFLLHLAHHTNFVL